MNNYKSFLLNKLAKWKRNFTKLEQPYYYVFVRQDLSLADQLVQSNHASFAVSQMFCGYPKIPSLVLIGVPDKTGLESTINLLTKSDIKYAAFYEPDDEEGLTAIATEPITDRAKRSVLRSYSLWKPNIQENYNAPAEL